MYAPEIRKIYVELPPQDAEEGMCGKNNNSMYGTRGAAQSWEAHYTRIYMDDLGFEQGKASPCVFHHREKDLRVVVHGDDFTGLGADERWNGHLKVPGMSQMLGMQR